MKVPRGAEKGKSSNDDGHGHGQKKRRPSTNVEGKTPIQAIWALNSAIDSSSPLRRFFDTPSSPTSHKKNVFCRFTEKRQKITNRLGLGGCVFEHSPPIQSI